MRCRSVGATHLPKPPCCPAADLVRNGTKVIQVRDRRIEPAPIWLHIHRQRFKCRRCGKPIYERCCRMSMMTTPPPGASGDAMDAVRVP